MDEGDCITKVNITLEEEVQNSVYQISALGSAVF